MSESKDKYEDFDWDCKTCLYEVLGVRCDASTKEIIKAYRKLSLKVHPDKHKENKANWESLFKILQEAYDTLKDSKSRERYNNDMPGVPTRPKPKSSSSTAPKPKYTSVDFIPFELAIGDVVQHRPYLNNTYYGWDFTFGDVSGQVIKVDGVKITIDFRYSKGIYALASELDLKGYSAWVSIKKCRLRKKMISGAEVIRIIQKREKLVAQSMESGYLSLVTGGFVPVAVGTVRLLRRDMSVTKEQLFARHNLSRTTDCPKKHGLVKFSSAGAFRCDVCKQVPEQLTIYGCRLCNYDVCHTCYADAQWHSKQTIPRRDLYNHLKKREAIEDIKN